MSFCSLFTIHIHNNRFFNQTFFSICFFLSFVSLFHIVFFFFNFIACLCRLQTHSYVPRLPVAGETVRATRHQHGFGGKGANEVVAAAKLGSKTALISKVSSIFHSQFNRTDAH